MQVKLQTLPQVALIFYRLLFLGQGCAMGRYLTLLRALLCAQGVSQRESFLVSFFIEGRDHLQALLRFHVSLLFIRVPCCYGRVHNLCHALPYVECAKSVVASISASSDRGHRKVTWCPVPFGVLSREGIGVSKAVKTVVPCTRVRVWSRGRRRQQWGHTPGAWAPVGKQACGSPPAPDA